MIDGQQPSKIDKPEPPGRVRTSMRLKATWMSRLVARVKRLRGPIAAVAAVGAVLSGLVGYWNAYRTVSEGVAPVVATKDSVLGARSSTLATTSPSESFAILPFNADASDPAGVQLADRLTADLTSSLKRGMPDYSVVSQGLAAPYKGKAIDARLVGRELNVRYVVEGVGRTAGGRAEVKVRLTETSTGNELWSDGSEFEATPDTKNWDLQVARLTNQVRSALYDADRRGVLAQPLSALNANELTIRADAIQELDRQSLSVLTEARSLYDKALRLNSNLPAALMGKALALGSTLDLDPETDRDRLLREYDNASARLVVVAQRQARAWNIRADALQRQWRWEAALEANARALKIDPTRVQTLGQRADILVGMGQPSEALELVDRAFSLQPADASATAYLLNDRCQANLALGRYDEAIEACEKATSLFEGWWSHAYLVAAYALRGNEARAHAERAKLLAQRPGFSLAEYKAFRISDVPAYLRQTESQLFAGLRKAGIPEK